MADTRSRYAAAAADRPPRDMNGRSVPPPIGHGAGKARVVSRRRAPLAVPGAALTRTGASAVAPAPVSTYAARR